LEYCTGKTILLLPCLFALNTTRWSISVL
jgi:hypothetical protein